MDAIMDPIILKVITNLTGFILRITSYGKQNTT